MPFVSTPVRFYTQASESAPLGWDVVDAQLANASLYWVSSSTSDRYPHPRPVWGVWLDGQLALSIGTPSLRRSIAEGRGVTVHLESGLDVVIVEGDPSGSTTASHLIAAYNAKYDWDYDAETYGPLAVIAPRTILGWRAAGPAGRDGFVEASRWVATPA